METIGTKYAELDKFLKNEIYPDALVKDLTAFREQCTYVFMRILISEDPTDYHLEDRLTDQLYYLKRIIDIFSNIKNN